MSTRQRIVVSAAHRLLIALVAVLAVAPSASGQTKVTAPRNKYTPEQDVQLGREAAAEARKQYPVIQNDALVGYLDRLGKRLVAAAPPELNHPAFE
jgi:beta-barrel assembly-enhancing protease